MIIGTVICASCLPTHPHPYHHPNLSPGGQHLVVLDGLLHVPGVVLLDVVVRPNGVLQLVVDHLPGSLRACPADKGHDPGAAVRVGGLQQPDGDGERHPGRAERTVPLLDRPGVALQLAKQVCQAHVAGRHRLQEPVEKNRGKRHSARGSQVSRCRGGWYRHLRYSQIVLVVLILPMCYYKYYICTFSSVIKIVLTESFRVDKEFRTVSVVRKSGIKNHYPGKSEAL